MYFCNRSITSDAAASDRPARRWSCSRWSCSSERSNSGSRSTITESVTKRRTVETRRKAETTMFASTPSRRGAASDSRPRRASRGLEPTPESFLDETVERPDVLERKHAPTGQGIHPLQVADSFGQKPSDDLAPLDFGTGLHLAMQLRGDGQRDIGHRLDYVRAHNQTFGGMDESGGREAPPSGRSVDIHDKSLHCHMKNLQVRVDEDEIEDLDELAQEMRLSRSEIARSALREGVRRLRTEKALARYLNLEFTLSRAAQYAGVPIRDMADLAAAKGIPFFLAGRAAEGPGANRGLGPWLTHARLGRRLDADRPRVHRGRSSSSKTSWGRSRSRLRSRTRSSRGANPNPCGRPGGRGSRSSPSGATGSGGRPSAWGLARHPCSRRRKETASSSTRSRHGPLPRQKVEIIPASSASYWPGSRPAQSPPPARGRSWRSWPEARSG